MNEEGHRYLVGKGNLSKTRSSIERGEGDVYVCVHIVHTYVYMCIKHSPGTRCNMFKGCQTHPPEQIDLIENVKRIRYKSAS